MDVLLLSFSNDRNNPLATLADEYTALHRILAKRVLNQHFLAWSVSHATLNDVAYYLLLFQANIRLFLFSGHADRDILLTEDVESRSDGIANMLGLCPNLEVVILNGCSTAGQVKKLHDAGVPVVIATSAPVEDQKATIFSQQFFTALELGLNIEDAFDQAIGKVESTEEIKIYRNVLLEDINVKDDGPIWGYFVNHKIQNAGQWKLSDKIDIDEMPDDSIPNEHLLEVMYDTFGETNEQVRQLKAGGAKLIERQSDIVNALLKALPAPISEHTRKLLTPSLPGATDGYDIAGDKRLLQLAQTYRIGMDFLVYTMLSQWWENGVIENRALSLTKEQAILLHTFLEGDPSERDKLDYFTLLRTIRLLLENQKDTTPFINELESLRQSFIENEAIRNACMFMENIRRLHTDVNPTEMPALCNRAEENLALIISKIGFLGSYTLATIRNIDVQKYRHEPKAMFNHLILYWHGTLGQYDRKICAKDNFMDNKSVVLLRANDANSNQFLNLSPFILDQNTFEQVPDLSLSKLYFFTGRNRETGGLVYKYVDAPDFDQIDLNDQKFFDSKRSKHKYQPAIDQFQAFYEKVFQI